LIRIARENKNGLPEAGYKTALFMEDEDTVGKASVVYLVSGSELGDAIYRKVSQAW
jgi:hypothetical protein